MLLGGSVDTNAPHVRRETWHVARLIGLMTQQLNTTQVRRIRSVITQYEVKRTSSEQQKWSLGNANYQRKFQPNFAVILVTASILGLLTFSNRFAEDEQDDSNSQVALSRTHLKISNFNTPHLDVVDAMTDTQVTARVLGA